MGRESLSCEGKEDDCGDGGGGGGGGGGGDEAEWDDWLKLPYELGAAAPVRLSVATGSVLSNLDENFCSRIANLESRVSITPEKILVLRANIRSNLTDKDSDIFARPYQNIS